MHNQNNFEDLQARGIIDAELKVHYYETEMYERLKELNIIDIEDAEIERGRMNFEIPLDYSPTAFAEALSPIILDPYGSSELLKQTVHEICSAHKNSLKEFPYSGLTSVPSSSVPIYRYKEDAVFTNYKGAYYKVLDSGADNNNDFVLLLQDGTTNTQNDFTEYPLNETLYRIYTHLTQSGKVRPEPNTEDSLLHGRQYVKVALLKSKVVGEIEQLFYNTDKATFSVVTPYFYYLIPLDTGLEPKVYRRFFKADKETTSSILKGIWCKGDMGFSLNPKLLKFLPYNCRFRLENV
jgi:hypothetical protein